MEASRVPAQLRVRCHRLYYLPCRLLPRILPLSASVGEDLEQMPARRFEPEITEMITTRVNRGPLPGCGLESCEMLGMAAPAPHEQRVKRDFICPAKSAGIRYSL